MGFAVKISLLTIILIFGAACANTHCRRKAEVAQAVSPAEVSPKPLTDQAARIRVYKYDGSLQCQAGKDISVEKMAGELKGITIFSQQKKSDGLMHIQVCGSATGKANVYEILEKDLPKAEKLGFKKWNFE